MARRRVPTVYDYTLMTVDPPAHDPRGIRDINEGGDDLSLVRPCKPRPVSLESFHDNVILVVLMGRNDARSDVTFKQLKDLEKKYESRGFVILIIPTNQFGAEPGSDGDSLRYVRGKDALFPTFCKVSVNSGCCSRATVHPLIAFLKKSCPSKSSCSQALKGNYYKFLIDHTGVPRLRAGPDVSPLDLEHEILDLLDANLVIRVSSAGGGAVQGETIWAHKRKDEGADSQRSLGQSFRSAGSGGSLRSSSKRRLVASPGSQRQRPTDAIPTVDAVRNAEPAQQAKKGGCVIM